MADSDKDILITPNTSVATTHPEIKFVGKDNSPMYLRVLDDNSLSFEGTEGQVFSMSPTLSSGDIFSVNDISGVQSMAVNADGTITIDAQTKSTTIKNNASNTSTLILSNNNADAVDGPMLELFRDSASPADNDHMGAVVFTGRDDAGNKQEYGRIIMHNDDASSGSEEGELVFRLTENGTDEQEYMRLRGSTRQIEFNTGKDDIDMTWNSDTADNVLFCNAGTSRIGINVGDSPSAQLHVGGDTLSTGNYQSSSKNSYNTMQKYYYQRTSMGTGTVDLRAPPGGDGEVNPNGYPMPRAGKIMAFTIHFYGGSITTNSGTDTWRIRKFSGGSETTLDIDVARTSLVNPTGTNYTVTTELSSPMAISAGDIILIKRVTSGGSVTHVAGLLYVAFDL